jgi:AcrR family transcriptional regulator
MGRKPDLEHKRALTQGAADYLLARGYAVTTLRPLADALGTSSRMLLHHFGTKEKLIADALDEARARQLQLFASYLAPRDGQAYAAVLARAWTFLEGPEAAAYFRLFQEVAAVHRVSGSRHRDLAGRLVTDWLPIVERGFLADGRTRAESQALGTMVVAVVRGLVQDLFTTGERARIRAAHRRFTALLLCA